MLRWGWWMILRLPPYLLLSTGFACVTLSKQTSHGLVGRREQWLTLRHLILSAPPAPLTYVLGRSPDLWLVRLRAELWTLNLLKLIHVFIVCITDFCKCCLNTVIVCDLSIVRCYNWNSSFCVEFCKTLPCTLFYLWLICVSSLLILLNVEGDLPA